MITIKLFGLIKTLTNNQSELKLTVNGTRRVKDLVATLGEQYPQVTELIHKKRVLVSVNQEIAQEDTEIKDGDEVALLPPFAGGSQAGTTDQAAALSDDMLVRVQRESFSIDAEIDRVR